jgi:hypothetical protein
MTMATNNRVIENERDRQMLIRFIEKKALPFTSTLTDGKHRTTDQNKLQRLWTMEIAQQLGDQTPEQVRGYCKLAFGVPILRAENDAFRASYDEIVKPLPYEMKIKLMMEPFDFGVTRIMSTRQKSSYLDALHAYYSEQGVVLTNPDDSSITPSAPPHLAPSRVRGAGKRRTAIGTICCCRPALRLERFEMMTQTYFKDFERNDGTEVTVEYTITPYDPGVSSGPAEICYPPEGGEVEIVKVITDHGNVDWTPEEDDEWSASIFETHDFDDGYDDDYDRDVRWEDERNAN